MAIRSLKTNSFSRSLLTGNTAFMPGSYESIATVSVGSGGTSSADFTSVPSTYTHLQIRYTTYASNGSYLSIQFNGDTGTNYSATRIRVSAGTVESNRHTNFSNILGVQMNGTEPATQIYQINNLTIRNVNSS